MTQDAIKTPVKASCNVPKCNKTLKNKKNLTSHMEKVHRVVTAISDSPLANTVRTLFTVDNSPSVVNVEKGTKPKKRPQNI